jgi:hypothetical protein
LCAAVDVAHDLGVAVEAEQVVHVVFGELAQRQAVGLQENAHGLLSVKVGSAGFITAAASSSEEGPAASASSSASLASCGLFPDQAGPAVGPKAFVTGRALDGSVERDVLARNDLSPFGSAPRWSSGNQTLAARPASPPCLEEQPFSFTGPPGVILDGFQEVFVDAHGLLLLLRCCQLSPPQAAWVVRIDALFAHFVPDLITTSPAAAASAAGSGSGSSCPGFRSRPGSRNASATPIPASTAQARKEDW